MWKWVYYNSQTLQATCAFIGLLVLGVYAWDTHKIRMATLAQSSASRRPFFNIFLDKETQTWHLVNAGSGVALSVTWNYRIDSPLSAPLSLGAIAPTGHRALRIDQEPVDTAKLIDLRGVRVNYSDTAGKRYCTELEFQDSGDQLPFVVVDTGDAS